MVPRMGFEAEGDDWDIPVPPSRPTMSAQAPMGQPFNLNILQITPQMQALMKPVTSVDYYENVKRDLDENGLFSISIFGRMGDEARDMRFSYIDIKTEIFHPVIYDRLVKLKKLYGGIIEGKRYALWDDKQKDFVPANELDGQTGYAFFCSHWKDIVFTRNSSDKRDMRAQLVEKFRDVALTSKIIVIPAGLRDIEVDDEGRDTVGDINALYRKLISVSARIPNHDNVKNDPSHDLARMLLQTAFNELYNMLETMISGKRGMFQAKWASRNVVDSTRNVITAMDTSVEHMTAVNAPRPTDTYVGMWQLSRALAPLTIHQLMTTYLSQIFSYGERTARLVDPVTLRAEMVDISSDAHDMWNTVEGLEKVIASYRELSLRDKPVMVDDRYLALIYVPEEERNGYKSFRIFSDIEELPSWASRKDVRPINLMELLYLSGYKIWNDQVGSVTRYPISGIGSIYPTTVYAKTTVVGEVRRELGMDWEPLTDDNTSLAPEFPTYEPLAYQDSLVIHSTRLAGLGADNPWFRHGDVRRNCEVACEFP